MGEAIGPGSAVVCLETLSGGLYAGRVYFIENLVEPHPRALCSACLKIPAICYDLVGVQTPRGYYNGFCCNHFKPWSGPEQAKIATSILEPANA